MGDSRERKSTTTLEERYAAAPSLISALMLFLALLVIYVFVKLWLVSAFDSSSWSIAQSGENLLLDLNIVIVVSVDDVCRRPSQSPESDNLIQLRSLTRQKLMLQEACMILDA